MVIQLRGGFWINILIWSFFFQQKSWLFEYTLLLLLRRLLSMNLFSLLNNLLLYKLLRITSFYFLGTLFFRFIFLNSKGIFKLFFLYWLYIFDRNTFMFRFFAFWRIYPIINRFFSLNTQIRFGGSDSGLFVIHSIITIPFMIFKHLYLITPLQLSIFW